MCELLTRVALQCDRLERGQQVLDLWPKELGRSTQRVAVLTQFTVVFFDSDFSFVSESELAAFQEVPNSMGYLNL